MKGEEEYGEIRKCLLQKASPFVSKKHKLLFIQPKMKTKTFYFFLTKKKKKKKNKKNNF